MSYWSEISQVCDFIQNYFLSLTGGFLRINIWIFRDLFFKFFNDFINQRIIFMVLCYLILMIFRFNVRKVVLNFNSTNKAFVESWFRLRNFSSEFSWIRMHLRQFVVNVPFIYSFFLTFSINSFFKCLKDWDISRRI